MAEEIRSYDHTGKSDALLQKGSIGSSIYKTLEAALLIWCTTGVIQDDGVLRLFYSYHSPCALLSLLSSIVSDIQLTQEIAGCLHCLCAAR